MLQSSHCNPRLTATKTVGKILDGFLKAGKKTCILPDSQRKKFSYKGVDYGKHWKTLDDLKVGPAQIVVVATVDDPKHAKKVEIFQFDAGKVRKQLYVHFEEMNSTSSAPKVEVKLDESKRGLPSLTSQNSPISVLKLEKRPLEWKILLRDSMEV